MNEDQKRKYLEKYKQEKQKGVKFWPNIIYKDIVVTFALFLLLVGLAIFAGVAAEPKADPSDATYVPRPEWYFLWLFEFLKYIPGQLEWIGAVLVPGLLVLALFLLPFYDRSPFRYWRKRILAISVMNVSLLLIVLLTMMAVVSTPPHEESEIAGTVSEQVILGQDLYSLYCVECHGPDGGGGEIIGVEGLEGVVVKPINSTDEMYTRSDKTLYDIIAYGQPSLGMPPFGTSFGGELNPAQVEYLVAFMRYTWDDRAELPEEAASASSIPTLAPGEIPTWEDHIQPIFRRYCDSCHRPGKQNNDYITLTYDEVMTTGQNAPSIIPGDLNSLLLRLLHREDIPDVAGPMPPNKALPDDFVEMIEAWVLAGAPETASDVGNVEIEPTLVFTSTPTTAVELPASQDQTPTPTLTSTPTPTQTPDVTGSATPTGDVSPTTTERPPTPTKDTYPQGGNDDMPYP